MEHSDESIERAVLTLREMTQERRGRGISAVMMLEEQIISLRKDAERWRAMRELLIAVDWDYGEPPMSIAAFKLQTGVVMAGPEGADAIADAAVAAAKSGAA